MEKSILDIHLMYWPGLSGGNTEHKANGGWLHNWAEGFSVVNTMLLCKSVDHPSCLIPRERERAVRIKFMAENPFVGHH
jgi:hypothetical protein